MAVIFGKAFSGSGEAFELLIWTGVIIAIGHNWGELCIAAKRNRLLLQSTVLGAVVNIGVCVATVSRMGVRGAVLGNMAAEIAVHALLIGSFGWHMGPAVLQQSWKPVSAGCGAYAISLSTRAFGPPLCALLTAIAYLALLVATRGVGIHDFRRLQRLFT